VKYELKVKISDGEHEEKVIECYAVFISLHEARDSFKSLKTILNKFGVEVVGEITIKNLEEVS